MEGRGGRARVSYGRVSVSLGVQGLAPFLSMMMTKKNPYEDDNHTHLLMRVLSLLLSLSVCVCVMCVCVCIYKSIQVCAWSAGDGYQVTGRRVT